MAPAVVIDADQHSSDILILISNILHLQKLSKTHFGIQNWCLEIRILQSDLYILPVSNRPKEDWQKQILELFPHVTKHRKTNQNTGITRRLDSNWEGTSTSRELENLKGSGQ